MDNLRKNIDQQIESNKGKNLFFSEKSKVLKFTSETIQAIQNYQQSNEESENTLIDYASNKTLLELCRINQYYSFPAEAQQELKELYQKLFALIKSNNAELETVAESHYQNITHWLKKYNSFAEKIYQNQQETVEPIACSEYSPEIQIQLLHLNLQVLQQPILDIGCGTKASLVKYLRNNQLEAYGIDRFETAEPFMQNADWLNFSYKNQKWGTIISNLGFSNHFKHHHLREDGNFMLYAQKYIEILQSLKTGGSFHYAPDLPFIEQYLDTDTFCISNFAIENLPFKCTVIEKLK
jgi:hypothetical protein